MESSKVYTRAMLPQDGFAIGDLVRKHAKQDPSYSPKHDKDPQEWAAEGLGICLTQIVACDFEGSIIGHIAVGTVPHGSPQRKIFAEYLKSERFLEIRRGIVLPEWQNKKVGGLLSKVALRWTTERKYIPVAATLPHRKKSSEMLLHYQWKKIATVTQIFNGDYTDIGLWVPPEKIIKKIR